MESRNYHKTELTIVTVDDLDGEIIPESTGKNLLREKTFNSELTSLVNQIFNNEKMSEKPSHITEEVDAVQKRSLMMNCESLIYQLKHSEELAAISSSYNPFETDINLYDDIDDTTSYIRAGLMQCNFSRFQILKYNFKDRAYRSDINLLDPSYSSDMYFSTNDPLILQVNDNTEGFVISPELINSDPFFSKKFLNKDADDLTPRSFFLVKISSLFRGNRDINILDNRITGFDELLSPLLLVELNPEDTDKPDEIFKALKNSASIPLMLYFLKNRAMFSINNYSSEDILLMLELFFKSAVNSELKSYIITLKNYSSKDNIFILKFIISKIRKISGKNSMILRISLNNAIIITSSEVEDIYKVLDRVNSGVEIIKIQPVDYNVLFSSKEFVNLFL